MTKMATAGMLVTMLCVASLAGAQSGAFDETLTLQGISFRVQCPNDSATPSVIVTPAHLTVDNSPMTTKAEGRVIGAEVADLNADGSPEVYVFVRSAGTPARASLIAYAANRKKSLSGVFLPALTDDAHLATGYRGGDELAIVERSLVRRFPLYRDGDTTPTGGTRQIHYTLTQGEAGWILKAGKAITQDHLPLGFSVSKMDTAADPRKDFGRYAAGRWLDHATVQGDAVRVSAFELLADQVQAQVQAILEEAARASLSAPRHTSLQQVGDLYASGMDVKRLTELGVTPLKPEFDRIAAISTRTALAEYLAHLMEIANDPAVVAMGVSSDTQDRTRYSLYAMDGPLPLPLGYYLDAAAAPVRDAYVTKVAADLALAGTPQPEATAIARKIVQMEVRVARKKLSPVEMADPAKRFVKMPFADVKALVSNFDLDTYLRALGLQPQPQVIVMDVEALRERNAMLADYSLADLKDYLRWEVLRRLSPYLTPAFIENAMTFSRVLYGPIATPARHKLVAEAVTKRLGHPVSQLYVQRHFPAATKQAVEEMVGTIRAEFRSRLEHNTWLSAETRTYALTKLDKAIIRVGYPSRWIDYSGVDIRREDYFGNMVRLNAMALRRDNARLGTTVVNEEFSLPGQTLPIDINAAYRTDQNNIEIPAAFLQPPFYDSKADHAVNYCTMGAVIGHEITHGFDSQGRQYDATGAVRDWWTAADAQNFLAEARKLVAQADAFEAAPGTRLNGELTVGENLADVGGVSLGYSALKGYLNAHPEANRPIDGFTPEQRCFVAWAQLWADKWNVGYLKQTVATDPHPPGNYRASAPLKHERGFYETFGIKPGDPMWLDVSSRVVIW